MQHEEMQDEQKQQEVSNKLLKSWGWSEEKIQELQKKIEQEQQETTAMLSEEMEEEEARLKRMNLEDRVWHEHLRWELEQALEIPPHLNHLRPEQIPLRVLKVLWRENTYNDETGQSEPLPGTY